jgi:hypothetical protein
MDAKVETSVWVDDRNDTGDSPFLKFVDRLARTAADAPKARESLKSNGLRARRIKRRRVRLPQGGTRKSFDVFP